jgi:hypothetical protein
MTSHVTKSAVVIAAGWAALLACRNGSPPTVATDSTGSSRMTGAASAARPEVAAEAGSPSAPTDTASPGSGTADAAGPLANACLMVNVCSCNLGCAKIRVPRSQLNEGTRTRVVSGPLAGQEVKIVEVVDASGTRLLALTDLNHDHACSLPSDRGFSAMPARQRRAGQCRPTRVREAVTDGGAPGFAGVDFA